jgi:hypothetical protein
MQALRESKKCACATQASQKYANVHTLRTKKKTRCTRTPTKWTNALAAHASNNVVHICAERFRENAEQKGGKWSKEEQPEHLAVKTVLLLADGLFSIYGAALYNFEIKTKQTAQCFL